MSSGSPAAKARIWCITGYKGVGKDAVGQMLVEMDWVAHQFIDPAYRAVAQAYGIPFQLLKESPFKDTPQTQFGGKSPRNLVADMCDHIRERTPNGMVDLWLRACKEEDYRRVVATGLRMPDEIMVARMAGAAIVRVDRPGFKPFDKYDAFVDTIQADAVINNQGSLYDLRQELHRVLEIQPRPFDEDGIQR